MPARRLHKSVQNSRGMHHRVGLLLSTSADVAHAQNLRGSAGAVTLVAHLESPSDSQKFVQLGGIIGILTVTAMVIGVIKGSWSYAVILGSIALGQSVAILISSCSVTRRSRIR